MIAFPISKINLGLRITGKRQDGYHDIETVFYPVMLCDALEFVVSGNNDGGDFFAVTGISTGSRPEDNLVLKTINKLREKYTFPGLKIHLHKAIPVGAGLGGGSSDSACILHAINRYFGLNIPATEQKDISLEMGSDCPFFIEGVPAFASGRGEKLSPVKPVLKDYWLVLLNPGLGINTKEAYRSCRPGVPQKSLSELIFTPVDKWKNLIINDFEEFAFNKHPIIGELKNELYNSGALFSLMSGSGSSVYGIFHSRPMLSDKLREFVIYEGVL